jgi:hypothetical protein
MIATDGVAEVVENIISPWTNYCDATEAALPQLEPLKGLMPAKYWQTRGLVKGSPVMNATLRIMLRDVVPQASYIHEVYMCVSDPQTLFRGEEFDPAKVQGEIVVQYANGVPTVAFGRVERGQLVDTREIKRYAMCKSGGRFVGGWSKRGLWPFSGTPQNGIYRLKTKVWSRN